MKRFPSADEMVVDARLPADSIARYLRPQRGHILIRPVESEGVSKGGIIVQRTRKRPKVLAHVLAISRDDLAEHPQLEPGALVCFRRFADEDVGEDRPREERWLGQMLPVMIVHIKSVDSRVSDTDVQLEY